jgi:hypothetical protein
MENYWKDIQHISDSGIADPYKILIKVLRDAASLAMKQQASCVGKLIANNLGQGKYYRIKGSALRITRTVVPTLGVLSTVN